MRLFSQFYTRKLTLSIRMIILVKTTTQHLTFTKLRAPKKISPQVSVRILSTGSHLISTAPVFRLFLWWKPFNRKESGHQETFMFWSWLLIENDDLQTNCSTANHTTAWERKFPLLSGSILKRIKRKSRERKVRRSTK